jgi:hypothetical protein
MSATAARAGLHGRWPWIIFCQQYSRWLTWYFWQWHQDLNGKIKEESAHGAHGRMGMDA